jgi:hypothetical protein
MLSPHCKSAESAAPVGRQGCVRASLTVKKFILNLDSGSNVICSIKTVCAFLFAMASVLPAMSPPQATAQSTESQATNDWTKADAVMAAHLKQIDPNMRSAQFASALLRRYLPDFRVYVRFDRHMSGETRIFLVNRSGQITPLPNEEWTQKDGEKFARSPQVAEFIRQRKLKVQRAEEAVEVAKLFEEVQGAANYVAFLNINTKDFKVFDKAFIESQFGPRTDWKYSAKKSKEGWSVKVEYVGPPASIRQPPVYEIDLDGQQTFRDLRRY